MSVEFIDYKKAWSDAQSGWGSYLDEAEKDLRLTYGDQWDDAEKMYLKGQARSTSTYNKTKRIINFISGYEQRNRLSLNAKPRGGSDDSLANQQSALMLQIMSNYGGYSTCSDAFKFGTCITGLNLVEVFIDHNGNIGFNRDAYNQVLVDPLFSKPDLSDCAYIIRERSMNKTHAKMFFSGREEEIDQLRSGTNSNLFSRSNHSSRILSEDSIVWGEYHRQILKEAIFTVNRQTGEELRFQGNQQQLNILATELQHMFAIKTKMVPAIRLQIFLQDQLFYDGPDPYGMDEYRFTPVMGDYVPELPDDRYKLQGIARSIRDPQIEFNKRMSQSVDILESQISSGWIAEEGQVIDPNSLYQTGQGKVVYVKNKMDDNLSGTAAVQRIQPPTISAGMDKLPNDLADLINTLTGTNEELLGTDNKDIPGILSRMRTGAALTTLQPYFDGYRFAKRRIGKLIIKMAQKNYSPAKIQKLLEEPVHPQFYDVDILDNDITVQEGIHTDSQRETAYAELVSLKERGLVDVPESLIIKHMPIHLKDEFTETLIQQEQVKQQAQQMQQQAQLEQLSINSDLVRSETAQNMAKVRELDSEVLENKANAMLDRAKTITEIQKNQREINSPKAFDKPRKPRRKKVKV